MKNVVGSFAQGVALEQSIRDSHERSQTREHNKRLSERASERAEQSHNLSMARGNLSLQALSDEMTHRKSMRPVEVQTAKNNQQASKLSVDQAKHNLKVSEHTFNKRLQNDEDQKKKDQAKFLYPHVIKTLIDTEGDFEAVHQKYPEYFALTHGMNNEFNLEYMMNPNQRNAVNRLADIINPNTPSSLSDPDALDVVNTVFEDQINRGEGVNPETGQRIVSKRASEIYMVPGQPGKLALGLSVEDEGGNVYQAPRTKNASTDESDTVKIIDARQVVDQVNAKQKVAALSEKLLQADPSALKRIQAIYQAQTSPSNNKLQPGYMAYGNTSIKFDDAFKQYQSYLPSEVDDPEGHAYAKQALPWDLYRWAMGDSQKMQFALMARQRNAHVYKIQHQRLSELDPTDYAGQERVLSEMQDYLFDPISAYNQSISKVGQPQQTEAQSGKGVKVQSGKGAKVREREKPERKPMSLEDFSLLHQAKQHKRKEEVSRVQSRFGVNLAYGKKQPDLQELYKEYLDEFNEETAQINAREKIESNRQKQNRIKQLREGMEKGRLNDAQKQELKELLSEEL